ncbi:TPA: tetratricopeptide repeat protein [Legionella pneumophila]
MNLLIAIGHIIGAVFLLLLFEFAILRLSAYQSKKKQKLLLIEISSSLGVEIDDLNQKELSPKITDFIVERFSNEVFRNRLSDFLGSILTIWQGLGILLYILVFTYVIWSTLTEDFSYAIYAWLVIPIAIFFGFISFLCGWLCWFITGRYPGQAKKVREQLNYNFSESDNIQKILDQDYQMTFKFAEQGVSEAQFSLGNMYTQGKGITQDYKQAFKWFSRAAEQGHSAAQNNLGSLYLSGDGINQDNEQALKWFSKAAEQGQSEAQHSLGGMYYLGQGVTQDYKQAFKWFSRAAEQGNPDAQYSLGRMYSLGEGVTEDYQKAYNWLIRAAEQGHSSAITVIQ